MQASADFAIPFPWIDAVIQAESGGRTHLNGRPITSKAGAMGLMQLMPGTYDMMRVQHGLGPDPHAPCDNIRAGTAYLRAMYDRFGYPGLFGAYNAGPGRYADWLKGRPLPLETRLYLRTVVRAEPTLASGIAIFVGADTPPEPVPPEGANGLFVPLSQMARPEGGP
ncbi:lytic transglycosylase domain-containing protein [Asticcacaulis sp. LKC15W]|uniref:Lytic transglycosylase domain-containing protein n=2 Tax=Asticcacaulis machinosus TaxID=2984211 RepID=A0ABT5HFY5_9CAUL|nr:lytic transglycosylase domain-containing protein [Asticcacaulis machinosus]MDC7675163.1 lytic transglycosylase domain-containing protein [Asticcacaulis machinosus]